VSCRGARLSEVELVDRLGLSPTPVYEALTRLAAESWSSWRPTEAPSEQLGSYRARERVRTALGRTRLTALAVPNFSPPTWPSWV
jgi:hypothetical protein